MERLVETLTNARRALGDAWTDRGAFRSDLSPAALSTATASMAFALAAREAREDGRPWEELAQLARGGHAWLCANQNADGGFGDTPGSPTNISTTTVCWASLGTALAPSAAIGTAEARAGDWLRHTCGGLTAEHLAPRIRERYGRDHTFSVPILTTCALAGRFGTGRSGWREVPQLPFELAAFPQSWFKWLQLRTVSYALPALIGIGQARHHHRPTRNPVTRLVRTLTRRRTLRTLRTIQPGSGGYLEAAPLTSFVSMSLISIGLDRHPVVEHGLRFLRETVRENGSWPIDTNLDTWVTTLAVNALAAGEAAPLAEDRREPTRAWLLEQQYRDEHPFTRAAPGGWAWTDLTGGVPDADDTPGALLALRHLCDGDGDEHLLDAATHGIGWLLDLQNRDGGIPTFCRGWGKLPFDRSSQDLTAHTLRAFAAWRERLPSALQARVDTATLAGIRYLLRTQRDDGAWVPLWFGNQQEPREENPLYGTSRVLRAITNVRCDDAQLEQRWRAAGARASRWLLAAQRACGGFSTGPEVDPSIEETALALEAIAESRLNGQGAASTAQLERAADWLAARTELGSRFPPSPIGLYFAKLWYWERLYPVVFTVSALEFARRALQPTATRCETT